MFLGKGILKICTKFTGGPLYNFIEIAFRHWRSPVNLLHIFRTSFPKNTSEGLLLVIAPMLNPTEHVCIPFCIKTEVVTIPLKKEIIAFVTTSKTVLNFPKAWRLFCRIVKFLTCCFFYNVITNYRNFPNILCSLFSY